MMTWIDDNKQWLFSGLGVTALSAMGYLVRYGYQKWRESQDADSRNLTHARIGPRRLESRFPGPILRAMYSPERAKEWVKIALRENAPGEIYLNNLPPFIDLYFQITNLGPVDLVLDRAVIEVWFSQPTFSAAILNRYKIPAGEITDGIHLRQMLADNQKAQIESFTQASQKGGRLHINITAYFESKLGRFSAHRSIERDKL